MDISLYLAQLPGEVPGPDPAWLLCPFEKDFFLPELPGGIFVFTDSIAYNGQSPEALFGDRLDLLQERKLLVLDFQRKDDRLKAFVHTLRKLLTCPVAAPPEYLGDGPVFLPPIPPDTFPQEAVEKWRGKELVLDLSPLPTNLTLTKTGCLRSAAGIPDGKHFFEDTDLLCSYRLETLSEESARFTLWRNKRQLLEMAGQLGVTACVALKQEWEKTEK